MKGFLEKANADPYANLLGVRIDKVEKGYALCSAVIREEMFSFLGLLHGGFIFSLADVAFSIAANGGIMSNSSACFMRYFGKNAGVASALLGAMQYAVGAAISALAAMLSTDTIWPMILAMLFSTLVALTGATVSSRFEPGKNTAQPSGS